MSQQDGHVAYKTLEGLIGAALFSPSARLACGGGELRVSFCPGLLVIQSLVKWQCLACF